MYKLDYIPYGAQYYRAPTPLQKDWERDIKNMASYGFNTIKLFVQWCTNNIRRDEYDFSDIRTIMDIACKNHIRVILNLIFDTTPMWFCKVYPESVMVTADGRRMEYRAISYRQAGGAPGPCLHHSKGIHYRRQYLYALAKELGNHPALLLWDLWNEPELGSGIENREPAQEDLLCYCPACRDEFRVWLKAKYRTLDALNHAWNKFYGEWEEIEPPYCGQTWNDMIDWRAFFADTIVEETRMRRDAIRAYDKVHPTMVHTVPLPYFNMVAACSDDYRLACLGDLHGNSLGTNPFSAMVSVSAAEGKPVISSEMQIDGGDTYGRPGIQLYASYKKYVFVPLSKGVKGFQYWQYRAERLGTESPAWGLTRLDGTPAPQLEYAVRLNRALQQYSGTILESMPALPKIAVINASENQVFDWCSGRDVKKAYCSMKGIFDALHDKNYNADIVSSEQLTEQKLQQYRVIFYPFPHYIKDDLAHRLKKWVEAGGTLVSEAFFAAVTSGDGLFSERVPGLDFHHVFGAEESVALTASMFHDPYNVNWSTEDIARNIIGMKMADSGEMLHGYYFSQGFTPYENTEILASFGDGRIAAVKNKYGKGTGILIGSLVGYAYEMGCSPYTAVLFEKIVSEAGVNKTALTDTAGVRIDTLQSGGKDTIVVVTNNTAEEKEIKVSALALKTETIVNMLTGEMILSERDSITVKISGGEIEAYICI